MQSGTLFYVGTYTQTQSEGIYKYSLQADGTMELVALVAKSDNPSFLTKSADNRYLIAVNENDPGTVSSFKIHEDSLQFINQRSSGGVHPCFVTVNDDGYILTANYSSGNIGLLQLADNGALSALMDVQQHSGKGTHERQDAPHAHSVWFDPDRQTIISVDLGTNELLFSSINTETKKLVPLSPSTLAMEHGAGPRHLAFHPQKPWIYVINELNSTVSLIKKNENGYKLGFSFSTVPKDHIEENTTADIHISRDGRFLYASNRGHNSIAVFSIGTEGKLALLGHESTRGNGPRNFALSPDNTLLLVANQFTDNIVSFRRDSETGSLDYISEVKAPTPVCILF